MIRRFALGRSKQRSRIEKAKQLFSLILSVDRSDFFFFFYINDRVFNAWKRGPLSMLQTSDSFFFSFSFHRKIIKAGRIAKMANRIRSVVPEE